MRDISRRNFILKSAVVASITSTQVACATGLAVTSSKKISKEAINKVNCGSYCFSSIKMMASASWLVDGDIAITTSRKEPKNGGGGRYLISSNNSANEINKIEIKSGLVAVLIPDNDGYVNSLQFGAIDDCISDYYFGNIPTGTDSTLALKEMFESGEYKYCRLGRTNSGTGVYLVTDNLTPTKMTIEGANCIIHGDWTDRSKSIIVCKGQSGQAWCSFSLRGSSFMPHSGIEFKQPDNQAMTLTNISAQNSRYGAYLGEGECINRIRIINCNFQGLFAGIYFDSFAQKKGYAQSAPVFFENTIINACGLPQRSNWWNADRTTYKGVRVIKRRDPRYGRSLYLRGFGNVIWRGGQISDHGENRLLNHICCENVNGITFIDPDIEIVRRPVNIHGQDIQNANSDELLSSFEKKDIYSGCVIVFNSCPIVKFSIAHTWALKNQVFIRLVRYAQGCEITLPNSDDIECKYLLDTVNITQERCRGVKVNNVSKCSARSFIDIHSSSLTPLLTMGSLTGKYIEPLVVSSEKVINDVSTSGKNISYSALLQHFDQGSTILSDETNVFHYALVNAILSPSQDPLATQTDPILTMIPCSLTYPCFNMQKIMVKCQVKWKKYNRYSYIVISFYDSSDNYISHIEKDLRGAKHRVVAQYGEVLLQTDIPSNVQYLKFGFVIKDKKTSPKLGSIPIDAEIISASLYDLSENNSITVGGFRNLLF